METDKPSGQAEPARIGLRWLRRPLRWGQWVLNLAVLAAALLVLTPAADWLAAPLVRVDPLAKADFILVLGGNNERAAEAAALYRAGWAKSVIVSSTPGGTAENVRIVRAYGVPDEDVIRDAKAVRTASHPQTVAALPGIDRETTRLLIVTSRFHTARAKACFQAAGYRNLCVRAPRWSLTEDLTLPRRHWDARARELPGQLYEVLAMCYYKLRGWV